MRVGAGGCESVRRAHAVWAPVWESLCAGESACEMREAVCKCGVGVYMVKVCHLFMCPDSRHGHKACVNGHRVYCMWLMQVVEMCVCVCKECMGSDVCLPTRSCMGVMCVQGHVCTVVCVCMCTHI